MHTEDPAITVIMPVYNAEEYLPAALDSILGQTERAWELIAVDDGCTDGSSRILREYARRDGRLKVLTQENQGCSAGRNTALPHARGKWLAFLDADDWIEPRCLETWRKQAEAQQLDLLIGNGFGYSQKINGAPHKKQSKVLLHKQPWEKVLTGRDWIRHAVEVEEWPHYVWLQLVRGDFLETLEIEFRSGIGHQDILWTTHLALAAQRVGFCKEPFCGYRRNPGSVTRKTTEKAACKRAESYLVVLDDLITTAEAQGNRSLRKALLRQVNREAGHFLGLIRKKITTPAVRADLIRRFLRRGVVWAMLRGAGDAGELWRAIRCWMIFRTVLINARFRGNRQGSSAACGQSGNP